MMMEWSDSVGHGSGVWAMVGVGGSGGRTVTMVVRWQRHLSDVDGCEIVG